MITANDLWLRGQTAQRQFMQIANYNSAFLSTAMVQVAHMSVTAPRAFWSAMARAGGTAAATEGKPVSKPSAAAAVAPVKAKPRKAPAKPKLAAMTALEKVAERPSAPRVEAPTEVAPAKAPSKAAPTAKAAAKPKSASVAAAPVAETPKAAPAAPAPKAKAPATEPVKAPAKAVAAPAPKPVAAAPAKPDDLTVLSGVGAKLAGALQAQGVTTYRDIAALDDDGIARIDATQKGFRMLCARYDVVGQAKAMS